MYVIKITDGLGNQMFQYAFAKKIQMISKKKVYLDIRYINHEDFLKKDKNNYFINNCSSRKYGLNHFKTVLPIADQNILSRWSYLNQKNEFDKIVYQMAQNNMWFTQYRNESESDIKKYMENFKHIPATYFEGFFFDLFYYDDIRKNLQKEFCLKEPLGISGKMKDILHNRNTVSIHVRKGDFVKLSRDISQKPYYANAIKWANQNIENPCFLLFSDDINWVKQNIKIDGDCIYVSDMGFADYEEMAIMKHCKNNIIANSTFSYWAAYLNANPDKKVVYPKNWRKTIIPKEWIGL